ncbi:MAG: hypothetical protein GX638_02870 [Crenarchaeota archaeon]|nr:hypothetical protein [Thermoproteota archaeon]
MDKLLEVFALEDAFREFSCSDMCNASLSLLRAMNYPVQLHSNIGNQKIENFIYFTVQNKCHYSAQEMIYLRHIETASFLCELRYCDLLDKGESSDDTIVFLAIEINSSEKNRSEDSFYISQILSKTYNGFVVLVIKNADNIMFCTHIDDQATFMSEWFNINSTCMELFPLQAICHSYISGVRTVKDYYYELVHGFSRDYIRYPESYEYNAYQALPCIKLDMVNNFISKQEIVEHNHNKYKEKYDYDYIVPDNSFGVLHEEDDKWALLELGELKLSDEDIEDEGDYDYDADGYIEPEDYSDIDKEILNDPVKLLKWLEQKDRAAD